MMKAAHRQWAKMIFHSYAMNAVKKDFDSIFLTSPFPRIPMGKSLILSPTHSSWWDGFFSFFLCKKFCKRKFHIMMLEQQLKRFWYFRFVGAFSILPKNRNDVLEVFGYTERLLCDSRNLVTIFPEGQIIPQEESRPIESGGIIHHLAKKIPEKFLILPLVYRIHFREARKPELWITPGSLLEPKNLIDDKMLLSSLLDDLSRTLLLSCLEGKGVRFAF